ncbi:HEPN domain-containing protein [uncultured Draconibacterium sp.]|uniref:HEPN domain-containing protein n=1 Tax=uncultured Draconibacterium sp. TaxID=1573823 RepID=UPI002AA7175C|nr:HEPN domain-containing protein [uncultured Draconibacterium sp.]
MDRIKDKYEIILGFLAVVISFAAFKDSLGKISIDLGFLKFSLADYFLVVVSGFLLSIYLYTIESVLNKTKLGNWKGFNYILLIAYTIFVAFLFSPIPIGIVYLVKLSLPMLIKHIEVINSVLTIISFIVGIVLSYLSNRLSKKVLKAKKNQEINEIEEKEITDLDLARNLFKSEYYSQTILEASKILELHLTKLITRTNNRVRKNNFRELLDTSLKLGFIDQSDYSQVQKVRKMRNDSAHLVIEFSKEQAEESLNIVEELIKKSAANKSYM